MGPHIFADPGSQNLADPTDPDPKQGSFITTFHFPASGNVKFWTGTYTIYMISRVGGRGDCKQDINPWSILFTACIYL